MILYKPVHIENLQEIQDAVARTFPEMMEMDRADAFTLPKNKVLEIRQLRKLLKKLGLFFHVEVVSAIVAPAGTALPDAPVIHVDKSVLGYTHSFNIPIRNCENTFLNYYKANGDEVINYTESGHPYPKFNTKDCELIDQVEMCQAHIVDTSVPHAVVNPNNTTRTLIAIRLKSQFDFNNFQSDLAYGKRYEFFHSGRGITQD
jgi:hypothetical protein